MTTGERIKHRRESLGLSVRDVADKLGVHRSTFYRYENNSIEGLPADILQQIAVVLHITPAELMGDLHGQTTAVSLKSKMVPIIGTIACGTPITAEQNIQGYAYAPNEINADFCLISKGDSMEGAHILDGDIVYIRQQERVENGQIAAVRIGDEATLKRFFLDGNKVTLMPSNDAYTPMTFVADEINDLHIEGLAVGLYRKF